MHALEPDVVILTPETAGSFGASAVTYPVWNEVDWCCNSGSLRLAKWPSPDDTVRLKNDAGGNVPVGVLLRPTTRGPPPLGQVSRIHQA